MILGKLKALLKHNGYKVFLRPFELNIVGIRANSVLPNRFDDEMHVFYKVSATDWNYHVFRVTTDPGTFWLLNPMNPHGTGILEKGQYIDAYQLGMHRGQYEALVQRKPVTVIRDYDRNAHLDFNNGRKETGIFGINIHRANAEGTTKTIDKYSAGCQVFENADAFRHFLSLCRRHAQLYGNRFTYTLIDFRAVNRETLRRFAIGVGVTGGALAAGLFAFLNKDKIKTIAEEIGEEINQIFNPQKLQRNEI
jgi:hypothetical protein